MKRMMRNQQNTAKCRTLRSALVAVAVVAVPLAGQEVSRDTARVAPVVVSATRTPLSQSSQPVAVTVITAEQMRLRGITTVAEALDEASSAYVAQSGSQGGITSLFLRGGESKYVKVLIDGVAANEPGGAYDFSSLTTDNVERIEIVRGPASVIYGADAVTGVVHIMTRRGAGPPRVDAELRGGSMPREPRVNSAPGRATMSVLDASAALHGAIPSGAYSFSLAQHVTGGLYEVNNDYRNNVASGRFDLSPTEKTSLRFSMRYVDYRFHYPTNGGGTDLTPDSNVYRTEDRTVLGVEVEHREGSTRYVLALSSSVNDGGTDDQPDQAGGSTFVSQDKSRRRGIELRQHATIGKNIATTLGLQLEHQDQRSQYQSDGPFGLYTDRFSAARRNQALYAEAVVTTASSLVATLGARLDSNQQFGTFLTGRAGLSWRPTPTTRLRATAGTAFREPTFNENYASGFATGNPGLEPERTRSFDAGIDQQLFNALVDVGLTAFAQRFENMIDYTGSTVSCGFSYCNVAAAQSNGVELELVARLTGELLLRAGASVLRTKVLSPGFDLTTAGLYKDGESLIRRPEHKWNTELSYRPANRWAAAVRVLGVGQRTDRDFGPYPATPTTLPAYVRTDVSADYLVPTSRVSRLAMTLKVENLTNAYYESVFNFLAPRRTISLGLRASL
jgi:vitamin B12 transporter